MKTVLISPSQANPQTHISEMEDSCYFPQCRKDTNCECEMCLASINATLDLMPMSAQRSTLTKLSASKPVLETTPVSIDPTLLSTPESPTTPPPVRLPHRSDQSGHVLQSTVESIDSRTFEAKKRKFRLRGRFWRWVSFIGVVLAFGFEFSFAISRVLRPALSDKVIIDVVKECTSVSGLGERLNLVENRLKRVLGNQVSSCSLGDSTWKIDRDDSIMHSHCIMYRSGAEEVIIRGWPLQTAGLLTAGLSSRSFSVLSGRLTEWPEGNMLHVIQDENSTWTLQKRGASVVRFDPNTWIMEYRKSMFLENPSVLLATIKFLNFRSTKFVERMRQHLWLLPDFSNHASYFLEEGSSLLT